MISYSLGERQYYSFLFEIVFFVLPSSVLKPSGSRQNVSDLSSSQVKIEDWISTDMDPSKSKGSKSPQHTNEQIVQNQCLSV